MKYLFFIILLTGCESNLAERNVMLEGALESCQYVNRHLQNENRTAKTAMVEMAEENANIRAKYVKLKAAIKILDEGKKK